MKTTLPLALLAIPPALVVQAETVFALSAPEISQIAKPITVLISTPNSVGSGVIFKKEGNTYFVITAKHVIENADEAHLFTEANFESGYSLDVGKIQKLRGIDLAIVQFTSNRNYPVAKLGDSDKIVEGSTVYVTGFPEARYNPGQVDSIYSFTDGTVRSSSPQSLDRDGYAWIYSNPTLPGMSGGAVLNENGELVGIHGQTILTEDDVKAGVSLGIPINKQGNAKYELGDYEGVIEDSNQALRLDPNYVYAYYNRGRAKNKLKDHEGAIEDYNQALRLDPDFVYAYNGRGNAKRNLEDYRGAIEDYNQAIRLDPNYVYAYYNRGNAKRNLEDYRGAIEDYNQALRLDPNFADAYYSRGLEYENLGENSKAIADFRQAAQLFQQHGNQYGYEKAQDHIRSLQR